MKRTPSPYYGPPLISLELCCENNKLGQSFSYSKADFLLHFLFPEETVSLESPPPENGRNLGEILSRVLPDDRIKYEQQHHLHHQQAADFAFAQRAPGSRLRNGSITVRVVLFWPAVRHFKLTFASWDCICKLFSRSLPSRRTASPAPLSPTKVTSSTILLRWRLLRPPTVLTPSAQAWTPPPGWPPTGIPRTGSSAGTRQTPERHYLGGRSSP